MNTTALLYALGTVLCWGVYAVLLHMGSDGMDSGGVRDAAGNRMKAFLFVGIAYFVVAIIGPALVMKVRGTQWVFPLSGWWWSLVAGVAGAVGAFFLLMALSAGRSPAESRALPMIVPIIVFAGAPIVNTLVSTTKQGAWGYVNWKFIAGIILAISGMAMAMKYKPSPAAGGHSATPKHPDVQLATPVRPSVADGYVDVTRRQYWVS